jgi:PPOX class probable F420-dependent enzyme
VIFDASTERGAHALKRLETDMAAWLTTVTPDGQPQSMPVWFVWDGTELLVYGDHRAKRNRNLESNPRVSFHLPDDGNGGDIVTIEGTVRIDPDLPLPGEHPAYWAKYQAWIDGSMGGAAKFGAIYSMPIRITPTRGVTFPG